jgi:alkylation response protein AidB-like acyl-CoA dehydrogenase
MAQQEATTPKHDISRQLKNVSERDRKQIEQVQEMLGPDPRSMGFVKNLFWGNFREELVFPFPEIDPEETARCDQLLAELDEYLRNEHPRIEIDQTQQIPPWVIERLFKVGVLGMTIPAEYGGGGFGITSYNRALERIGRVCGSTAVLVSAHQSIGCKAIMLFGTDEQKRTWLPRMATDMLSAFCLSEPNVGCDAGGQETYCELSPDGTHYILNGEKKWATSAALSGLFTVMAKQKMADGKERVTALVCMADMPGIDIFSRNRSKCGIRGTWQARIRFTNVKVPRNHLLHKEGKGLNIALSCLNFGRCTLSAGMLGSAAYSYEQAVKWAQYRYQFDRPIAEFELVQEKLAIMAAYCYAMDAVLYMTTGMLDRADEDIMLETALCKVICSELGFRTVDHALQVMGGEGYMTENEVERAWRDSRINTIVEGANEVMHSFVFAYGSKQLGEWMLALRAKPMANLSAALRIGAELYLHMRRPAPIVARLHPSLGEIRVELEQMTREFAHQVKLMFKEHEESLISNQMIQRRLSLAALWIHALSCAAAKLDMTIRKGVNGEALAQERAIVEYFAAMAKLEVDAELAALRINADDAMRKAAKAAIAQVGPLPVSDYAIPEKTPDLAARGKGKRLEQTHIPQFGGGSIVEAASRMQTNG